MKKIIVLCMALCSWAMNSFAKEKNEAPERTIDDRVASITDYKNDTLRAFYDLNWYKVMPDVFPRYASIAYKTKDGWICRDFGADSKIRYFSTYRDQELKVKEGTFASFYNNGKIRNVGHYVNNKKDGKWITFGIDGMPVDTINYLRGTPFGQNCVYSNIGKLQKVDILDSQGRGISTSFFDDGAVKIKGSYTAGMKKDSVWTFFFPNEKISFLATYNNDSLIRSSCFDINGVALRKCIVEREPQYPGGIGSLWMYLEDHILLPHGVRLKTPLRVTVSFFVDTTGYATDINIIDPSNPQLEKIAVKVIKEMRPWTPGIMFNEKVKVKYTLPVTFYDYGY